MYPARFDYHRPGSLEEVVALLGEIGDDAKLLAGGASLIPLMKLRLAQPGHLVDLGGVPGLDSVTEHDGFIAIGAMTREADLERSVAAQRLPILRDAIRVIADPLVRNVGTVGGNVAHGDPANDHPAVMLALDAEYVALGTAGERRIPVGEFHVDLFQTALEPTEILTAVLIPALRADAGSGYVKFERQVGDYAIVAAAAVLEVDDGRVAGCRLAFTNLAPTAVRAPSIETALIGEASTDAIIEAAAAALRDDEIEPWGDLRATAEQKRRMARRAAARALIRARDRSVDPERRARAGRVA